MRQLVLVILTIALPLSNATAWERTIVDTVETRWPNGQLKEQYITMFYGGNERTWKDGQYRSWYQNGQLEYDGAYDNDLKAHTWTKWDSLGWKLEQISYLAGKRHGPEVTWHPNLQIHKSFRYLNGELHGLCTLHKPSWGYHNERALGWEEMLFYVEGALLATIKHSDSDRTDESARTYYNAANDIWIEKGNGHREFYVGKQVDGKKHGKWILWAAEGDKKRVDFYRDGELLEF